MTDSAPAQKEFESQGGDVIHRCLQCGTCSGSCPLGSEMDHKPRALFAAIMEGRINEALSSNTPWYCVSCYQCMGRCPQDIPVADLMYALKRMSLDRGLAPPAHKLPDMYRAFAQVTETFGRITEPVVMARYAVKHPKDALDQTRAALKMLVRGRLKPVPQHMKEPGRVKRLLGGKREG